MKKLISIFLILCMMATLLPTVAFAEDGDTENVVPIVVDFTKTTLPTGSAANTSYEGIETPGYEINTDKSTAKGVRVNFVGYGLNTVHDCVINGTYVKNKGWPDADDGTYNMMTTINVEVATAGYYSPELIYGTHNSCGDFAIYINGQYAGEITDAWDRTVSVKTNMPAKTLNTIYLKEGKNEISFKCTAHREDASKTDGTLRAQSYLLLNKLTFTPVDAAPTSVGFTSTLPAEVAKDDAVEFTVKPVMSDGTDMYFGIYDDEGTKITEMPITLTATSGTISNLTRTTEGISATFIASESGTATITATTTINGAPCTDTFDVIVTSDEDEEVDVQDTITMSVTGTKDKVTVDGAVQNSATDIYSKNVGASVTVVAEDIEGKIFRGWLRGGANGTVVWLDNEYTFTAATNVALFAKYTDAPAENAEAKEYYDWNGEFLAYDSYDSANLSKYGFKFDKWLSNVVENITRYVADYVAADKKYTITKPDGSKLENVAHESSVTLTNQTAVSWYVNGSLAAYGENYTFYATEDAIVTIDNKVQEGPIVNLTNPDGDTYILEYNANGKEIIEKGIIIGGAETSVASCFNKVISQRNDASGKLMTKNDTDYTTVRGYIIYKDGDTHRVVYADIAAQ